MSCSSTFSDSVRSILRADAALGRYLFLHWLALLSALVLYFLPKVEAEGHEPELYVEIATLLRVCRDLRERRRRRRVGIRGASLLLWGYP